MPKFAKGSPEAIQFMKELRKRRGNKRPITTNKQASKEHIQNIVNEALKDIMWFLLQLLKFLKS